MLSSNNLELYFSEESNFRVLESLLKKNRIMTLRELEYCARNYDTYVVEPKNNSIYSHTLQVLGKKRFDAFRRSKHFNFKTEYGEVKTNFAQLRFIQFTIQYGIYKFAKENRKLIFSDMMQNINRGVLRKKELKAKGTSKSQRKKYFIKSIHGGKTRLSHC